jgi:transposase-like protein
MTKRGRRNPSPAFKAKAASAAVKNEKTVAELARQFDVRGNQFTPLRQAQDKGATSAVKAGLVAAGLSRVSPQEALSHRLGLERLRSFGLVDSQATVRDIELMKPPAAEGNFLSAGLQRIADQWPNGRHAPPEGANIVPRAAIRGGV